MKVHCSWCEKEGRPAFLRAVPPYDSDEISHGLCEWHYLRTMREVRAALETKATRTEHGADWTRIIEYTRARVADRLLTVAELKAKIAYMMRRHTEMMDNTLRALKALAYNKELDSGSAAPGPDSAKRRPQPPAVSGADGE